MRGIDRLKRDHKLLRVPAVEQVLAEPGERGGAGAFKPAALREDRTVNAVTQEHPQTKAVFERCCINVLVEGCDCLDEVAWRHGMEVGELLEALETVTKSCACARGERRAPGDPVAAAH